MMARLRLPVQRLAVVLFWLHSAIPPWVSGIYTELAFPTDCPRWNVVQARSSCHVGP
jgi:hypothetical protein